MPRLVNLNDHNLTCPQINVTVPGGKYVTISDEQAKLVPDTGSWSLLDDNGGELAFSEQPSVIDTAKADTDPSDAAVADSLDPAKNDDDKPSEPEEAKPDEVLDGPGARARRIAQANADAGLTSSDSDVPNASGSDAATRTSGKRGSSTAETNSAPAQEKR